MGLLVTRSGKGNRLTRKKPPIGGNTAGPFTEQRRERLNQRVDKITRARKQEATKLKPRRVRVLTTIEGPR